MAEMRTLAIVAQNHLVNIMRLRSMVLDRDEPVGSYLVRLKGVAAVCKLTLQCSCEPQTTVSYADKEILHCLVKGLADDDIRRQVLGVVEQMGLDKTGTDRFRGSICYLRAAKLQRSLEMRNANIVVRRAMKLSQTSS